MLPYRALVRNIDERLMAAGAMARPLQLEQYVRTEHRLAPRFEGAETGAGTVAEFA